MLEKDDFPTSAARSKNSTKLTVGARMHAAPLSAITSSAAGAVYIRRTFVEEFDTKLRVGTKMPATSLHLHAMTAAEEINTNLPGLRSAWKSCC